ncbi:hypothetical protein BDV97DRAFT_410457 [Delphinella strobiligena]|nr:hypothetical protein BDV97DRAFT_410457 [Delphinella strobiligena]
MAKECCVVRVTVTFLIMAYTGTQNSKEGWRRLVHDLNQMEYTLSKRAEGFQGAHSCSSKRLMREYGPPATLTGMTGANFLTASTERKVSFEDLNPLGFAGTITALAITEAERVGHGTRILAHTYAKGIRLTRIDMGEYCQTSLSTQSYPEHPPRVKKRDSRAQDTLRLYATPRVDLRRSSPLLQELSQTDTSFGLSKYSIKRTQYVKTARGTEKETQNNKQQILRSGEQALVPYPTRASTGANNGVTDPEEEEVVEVMVGMVRDRSDNAAAVGTSKEVAQSSTEVSTGSAKRTSSALARLTAPKCKKALDPNQSSVTAFFRGRES